MKYGTRTGSIVGENLAAHSAQRDTNQWISRRRSLCWVCQKDKPTREGRTSMLIAKTGKLLTSENNMRKFVCFACKPEKAKE